MAPTEGMVARPERQPRATVPQKYLINITYYKFQYQL